MSKETNPAKKFIGYLLAGLLLVAFSGNNVLPAPKPTKTPTRTPAPTLTNTSAPASTPFACTSWDLASDFRASPNQENPSRDSCNNLGVWKYMGSSSLTRDPATYYLLSNFTSSYGGIPGLNDWRGNYPDGADFLPAIGYNATGTDQHLAAYVTWPAGTIALHPAPNQMAIMAWQSPLTGYISISGGVSDIDPGGGDGILWFINQNLSNLAFGGFLNGGSQTFANGTGGTGLNAAAVSTGDMIYLAINPNGNYQFDSTQVNLSITVTSPPTPTNTPTETFTPTATSTRTPTKTPTVTATPPPNHGGQGTCWASDNSWPIYTVSYSIDRVTIPISLGWDDSINSAAQTWSDVAPSHFEFIYSTESGNIVSFENLNNPDTIAETEPNPLLGFFSNHGKVDQAQCRS